MENQAPQALAQWGWEGRGRRKGVEEGVERGAGATTSEVLAGL